MPCVRQSAIDKLTGSARSKSTEEGTMMIAPKRFSYSLLVAGALLFTLATPPKAALGFTSPSHVAPSTTHTNGHRSFAHSASASAADQVDAANGAAGSASPEKKKKRIAILLCPAQFCVPVDYTELLDDIRSERTDGVDVVATRAGGRRARGHRRGHRHR